MRAPRSRPAAGGASAGSKLPTVGVSSAVRRAFNAALHPRDGHGRFRQTAGDQSKPAPRRRGGEGAKRETVGQKALKSSNVTGNDTIEVLSNRVRKYKGFTTVESFVANHPKGRAYALRTLAADHKAGRIGFSATSAGAAAGKDVSAPARAPIVAKDETEASTLPATGTAEREFHDDMLRAASVFGDRSSLRVSYLDGKPLAFQVDVLNEAGDLEVGVIQRAFKNDPDGSRYVDHSIFMLDDALQGAGQAKRFLAQSVEAYKKLGVDKIKLHANIDVGGYAWIKYGFKPDAAGAAALTEHATKRLADLKAAGHISDAMEGHLKRTIGFGDFQAAADIGGSTKVEFEGKSQSVGKHLFLGSDWTGELNLNDRSSMNQFNAYIGKQS